MTARTWLAIVGAPILGAAVYAWLTLASLAQATVPDKPTLLGLVVSGAVVGLVFELVVVVPIFLVLRRSRRLNAFSFVAMGSLAWIVVCLLLLLLLGVGPNGASATAVAMFLPGLTIVLAFWLLGGNRGVA
jgi:predicted membrane channel-forming protein YqfA (hemolysin III family)